MSGRSKISHRNLLSLVRIGASFLPGPLGTAAEEVRERWVEARRGTPVQEALERVEGQLAPFWRGKVDAADAELVWDAAVELLEQHALSGEELAELDHEPEPAARKVLSDGADVLGRLDGQAKELCEATVQFVYGYLADDAAYVAACEPAIYRALLQRLTVLQRSVDEGFELSRREHAEILRHLRSLRLALGSFEATWETAEQRELATRLETKCEHRATLVSRGRAVPEDLQEEILDLERRLRDGSELPPGFVLKDRYRLRTPLGQGGFAKVWLAYDTVDRQMVAVKVLHGQFAKDRSRRKRFFAGARQMAALQQAVGDGVVRVLQPQERHGHYHFFVMEYAAGGDLNRAVGEGTLPREDALAKLLALGAVLDEAHRREMVHRDIKPANILLTADGAAKLADFDLVKARDLTGGTRTEMGMGSLAYAPPELAGNAKTAGPAADVYSFALTIAFVLHGEPLPLDLPWRGTPGFLRQLDCPPAVQDVLIRATNPEPEQRWGSVAELVAAVREGLEAGDEEEPENLAADNKHIVDWIENDLPRLPDEQRAASLRERLEPVLQVAPTDFRTVGTVAWAIDYFLGRSSAAEERGAAHRLREELLAPLREARKPPDLKSLRWADIPAGSFVMGSPEGEGAPNEHPVHVVQLSAFRLGTVPVTNREFRLLVPDHEGEDDLPAVKIDWSTAYAYAAWLGGRLPTEAEWEYACRAGTTTRYWSGDSEEDLARVGRYRGNARGKLHPVGEKPANRWGLHDMHGLVWEWAADWFRSYEASHQSDPWGPPGGGERVVRGGSFGIPALRARSACRVWVPPRYGFRFNGFRVVLPAAPSGRS